MNSKTPENKQTYDFSAFQSVNVTGVNIDNLNDEQLSLLYQQARYAQAMCDQDISTMSEIVSEDATFKHMSGKIQTREEYFHDIENGSLRYFTIGIKDPVIKVDSNQGTIEFTSVLNANAYGARGTYNMTGVHHYQKINGQWLSGNK